MVDCSHGNSSKNHRNQPLVVDDICSQLEAGQRGITGVMFESNLNEGKQGVPSELPEGVKDVREVLKRGVSITDACVDFEVSFSSQATERHSC
jgi:3-deoxy-7-phosphoheptulonate synthase